MFQTGQFFDDDAKRLYTDISAKCLLTEYNKTEIDFPGETAHGFVVLDKSLFTLAEFSYRERPFLKEDWGSLTIYEPRTWRRPAFLVDKYSVGFSNGTIIRSWGASFVEIDEIALDTFFERQVTVRGKAHPNGKIFQFAKSNRKPLILARFFNDFIFPLDQALRFGLLRNNVVELALSHMQRKDSTT